MLSEKQLFKLGFLQGAAADGLMPEETAALAASALPRLKEAADFNPLSFLADSVKGIASRGWDLAGKVLENAPMALVGAPAALGAGIGYTAGSIPPAGPQEDTESTKKQEIISELNDAASRARWSGALRRQQGQQRQPGQRSLGLV